MSRFSRLALLAVLAALFFGGPSLVRFYTDWLWFGEVGYQQVFVTSLRSQSLLFVVTFVAAVAWMMFNLRIALAAIGDVRPVFTTREGLHVALPAGRQLRTLAKVVAVVIAVLVGAFAAARWQVWLAWWYAVPFGQADPILGRDVAFFVFSLPFWQFVRGIAQTLVVLAALTSGLLYVVSGGLTPGFPATTTLTPDARRHLALLAAVFFVLMAAGAWLQRAEYLVQPSGLSFGANYADVNGRMPASLVLMAAGLIAAIVAVVQASSSARRLWPIGAGLALYVLVSIGGQVYSSLLQRFVVAPNERSREAPYIQHNITATRLAFGLDGVEARELSGDARLTRDDIERNAATLENVRLWDHQPLLEAFGQIQEIRTYYDFVSVDNDRYVVDGTLRQVMLSARELNSRSLPNRTWVNERLTFTHGYGLTLGPVNQVTEEGLPVLFIRDLPPVTAGGLNVDQPSIYFGELTSDYAIVRTGTREFHYPRGDDNVFTQYDGRGGLPLDSLFRKALFALRFGAYQMILTDDITAESRIIFNRNITDRVRQIAPFLTFDGDPYLVLANGRLYWLYDAYTTSALYPYSTPVGGRLNYIRNSVKFVIDAYDGTTTAYLADERDPIAATYARIFPGMFTPLSQMPPAIRSHVRYPEDIFAVQAQVFATYHMTQPAVFYNREDQWEIPSIDDMGDPSPMQPYYTIMRLPGQTNAEFIQMLPFVPRGRDNLAAWLVARSDGENYGRLGVYQFPKQKLVFGPRQVVTRIQQDQEISPQVTLWNQQGSQVIWGTLMVIPIEESLVYVRPLYLKASGGRIPELTRVIVAYQNQIVMEPTLDAALARLFGADNSENAPVEVSQGPQDPVQAPTGPETAAGTGAGGTAVPPLGPVVPAGGDSLAAMAARARAHYERAVAAQRSGDWATYGAELTLLGQTLERMRSQ
jgi:uncharacterized membrane protein (UPF0182 family)